MVNAPSINEAINNLQTMRLVNKQLFDLITNDKTTLFGVLNSILKNFPGYEVVIARLLNTKLAQDWLKTVNPKASLKVLPTNDQQFNIALNYIKSGDLESLKQWLNKGYDPKYRQLNGWTLSSYAIKNGSLATLELLSKYNPNLFDTENLKTLLFIANKAINNALQTGQPRTKCLDIYEFLNNKLEQQISAQEASRIQTDIMERAKRINY